MDARQKNTAYRRRHRRLVRGRPTSKNDSQAMIQSKSNPAHRIDGNREIVTVFDGSPLVLARMKTGETLEDAQLRANPEQWLVIDHENDDSADGPTNVTEHPTADAAAGSHTQPTN